MAFSWLGFDVFERFVHTPAVVISRCCHFQSIIIYEYNTCFIHHPNTSSVYFIPLRYRRSSLTAVALGLAFSWLGVACSRDSFIRWSGVISRIVVIYTIPHIIILLKHFSLFYMRSYPSHIISYFHTLFMIRSFSLLSN